MIGVPNGRRIALAATDAWVYLGLVVGCGITAVLMWLPPAGLLPEPPPTAESNLDGHLSCGPGKDFAASARMCEEADPTADAAHAIESGDRRLLGAWARGSFLPGTNEAWYVQYEREYGVRYLYSGCVVSSSDEQQYRRAADKYAELYNEALLKDLEQ